MRAVVHGSAAPPAIRGIRGDEQRVAGGGSGEADRGGGVDAAIAPIGAQTPAARAIAGNGRDAHAMGVHLLEHLLDRARRSAGAPAQGVEQTRVDVLVVDREHAALGRKAVPLRLREKMHPIVVHADLLRLVGR